MRHVPSTITFIVALCAAGVLATETLATVAGRAIAATDAPHVSPGLRIETIAHVDGARELAAAPNGDLFVGTSGSNVMLIADADATAHKPVVFATLDDRNASGVALGSGTLYVGGHNAVWRIPYTPGNRRGAGPAQKIAAVRTSGQGGHSTTSVAVDGTTVYVGVGSSCNACTETDPTRAAISIVNASGGALTVRATRIRNPIALAIDPATNALWAGVAGQDELAHGHPYEIFDDVSAHPAVADYGWPHCYEDRKVATPGADCSNVAVAAAVFPAYETPIGAAFYDPPSNAAYDFGSDYHGGAFVALHGSWHKPLVPPRVVFVPFENGKPKSTVDWDDPGKQWRTIVDAFQRDGGDRVGRPTGVAVGRDGSLFVADDQAGVIYRIRPVTPRSAR